MAERYAKYLLCEASGGRRPCDQCDSCRWVEAGTHPDLRVVQAEAEGLQDRSEAEAVSEPATVRAGGRQIRIGQIVELADFVNLASHRGGRRVVLIHPAEAMNAHAANALLKSLEEPPPGAIFLLVSHRPAQLPVTVTSRCVRIRFALPERRLALAWLSEQGVADPERWLAYAGGAPRLALELARGEAAQYAADLVDDLVQGRLERAHAVRERGGLELLVDLLQRQALDCALTAFGLPPRYGLARAVQAEEGKAWLRAARALGPRRMLARHPLNPALFVEETLALLPQR